MLSLGDLIPFRWSFNDLFECFSCDDGYLSQQLVLRSRVQLKMEKPPLFGRLGNLFWIATTMEAKGALKAFLPFPTHCPASSISHLIWDTMGICVPWFSSVWGPPQMKNIRIQHFAFSLFVEATSQRCPYYYSFVVDAQNLPCLFIGTK